MSINELSADSEKNGRTILDEIAAKTRLRVENAKEAKPFEELRKQALKLAADNGDGEKPQTDLPFSKALGTSGLSFICEIKKASPSKGLIADEFPYLAIAKEYEEGGASAISVLTEPDYFLGNDTYLSEVAKTVKIPVLRKDFIVDAYQIYEAKLLGAQAVLFICALLDAQTLSSFIKIAGELGLSALVEIHNKEEIDMALQSGASIIGINNRDLKTFKVDLEVSAQLRKRIPGGVLTVAESGVKSNEDIHRIRDLHFDAVLIGESLMRSTDRKQFLAELKAASGR